MAEVPALKTNEDTRRGSYERSRIHQAEASKELPMSNLSNGWSLDRRLQVRTGGKVMSAKYMKVKVNEKWNFVPIPNPFSEYRVSMTCECDKCLKKHHASVYITRGEEE